jgi:hypothetical protein
MVMARDLSMLRGFHNGWRAGMDRLWRAAGMILETGTRMAVIPWRYPAGGAAIESARGKQDSGRLKAAAKSGCLFFGPYVDLLPGHRTARVLLEQGATGAVKMELAADRGAIASNISPTGSACCGTGTGCSRSAAIW